MRSHRIYVPRPLTGNTRVEIDGSQAGHILRVLRLTIGDTVTAFDGSGGQFSGRIAAVRRGNLTLDLDERNDTEQESSLDLVLILGVAQGQRMDITVQKATELGINRIVPVITERSVARPTGERASRRQRHWEGVAVSACEQCGRDRIPQIDKPCELSDVMISPPAASSRVVLSEFAGVSPAELTPREKSLCYLVGPEGGLTESEFNSMTDAGFTPVVMGPRTLRTETAAIAFAAIAQALWGDMGA